MPWVTIKHLNKLYLSRSTISVRYTQPYIHDLHRLIVACEMPILFIQLILNSTFYEDVEHISYNKSIVLIKNKYHQNVSQAINHTLLSINHLFFILITFE